MRCGGIHRLAADLAAPIVGSNGEVIGIIASVLGEYKSFPTSGISYAVSVKTIRDDFLGEEIGLDP